MTKDIKTAAFITRTNAHIARVKRWATIISDAHPELRQLTSVVVAHDLSKFVEPEFKPYIEINWFYAMKAKGEDYPLPPSTAGATFHHIKHNDHHPEFWDDAVTIEYLDAENRDKPSGKLVDATGMPMLAVAHMCADWMAMAEERGTDPRDWAKSNIGIRWDFNAEQIKLIIKLLELYK